MWQQFIRHREFSCSLRRHLERSFTTPKIGLAIKEAANAANLPFLDAGEIIGTEGIDGVHLTSEAQRKLGEAVAKKVSVILQVP